ncbi:MarR family transcriptional repressor of emrRAB [Luteibacter sp. Sphag1AF]|uniref:MarR family winged helix-turn-helix transcriptional regulator n=1 Tax=Luteibacter sp. Sphag1AF TaxID=2587031 RepID=UPI0016226ECB|nr:MarR family transcriptional regulator [Luteibacter sp. Sphag1AF]MBB3226329.1 MarR family transcriptional repressor of emrRAB [Luteibacter sp. Sphag1AF]
MASFAPTEQRLDVTLGKYPAFPRQPAALVRLVKHLYKQIHDEANAMLRPYGLNHPEYNILMMMYGTPDTAMNPSQLTEAAGEKSANVTRLTNELCQKGLIARTGSDGDRRKVTLTLTPAAIALIESFLPDITALLKRQTGHLDSTEQADLERLLKKMVEGFPA